MRYVIGMAAVVLSLAIPARGDLIDPVATITIRDDDANIDSSLVENFDFVGALQTPGFLASGTLIAPTWVLTAAHVVNSGSPSQYTFTVGGQSYTGTQIIQEPNFGGPNPLAEGNDIALLKLDAPVLNVAPAGIYGGGDELGRIGVMVGFGKGGTGSSGETGTQGTKRAGRNVIDTTGDVFEVSPGVPFDERILMTDFDSPTDPSLNLIGSPIPVDFEANVAGGDSGGGLFVDFGAGYWLVGVTSFVNVGNGAPLADYGSISAFTQVSSHTMFITANTGITPASIPEPPAWLLMVTVLSVVIFRRRTDYQSVP